MDELLERYYKGETSIAEENQLRSQFKQGRYKDDILLSLSRDNIQLPAQLETSIQNSIRQIHNKEMRLRNLFTIAGSVAALLIMIFTVRGLLPHAEEQQLILTDNMKKERFEDALRVIGKVLDDKKATTQQVIYEDNKLIIAIE